MHRALLSLAVPAGLCACTAPTDLVPRTVTIESNVPGATVYIDEEPVGTTPYSGRFPREPVVVAMVRAEGHAPQPVPLTSTYDPSTRVGVFWGYTTTDSMTHSVWEYAPSAYYVELHPVDGGGPDSSRRSSLKAFAMTYFADLQVELAAGDGPKLRMLHAKHFPHRDRNSLFRSLARAPDTDAVAFAEAVAVPQEEALPDFRSVHVVLAEEHAASLVSGFGHIFICLPEREVTSVDDLLGSMALNFGADIGPLGEGAEVGRYRLQPCHELVRKNTYFDQRSLTFFELALSEEQLAALREDLRVRLGRPYPYNFFRRSCGYYVWDWLDGPAPSPRPKLYLTPREAVTRILERFPLRDVRVIPSHARAVETYLRERPRQVRAQARRGVHDPEALAEIEDPVLRLLVLAVAESRATREQHGRLHALRSSTLRGPGGEEAARRLLGFQEELTRQTDRTWDTEAEGPAFAAGIAHRPDVPTSTSRFHIEAGMRDAHTAPRSEGVLREVSFLGLTVDASGRDVWADLNLVSIAMTREFHSFNRGTSNGAALGYAGLPNALGSRGACLTGWIGLDDLTPFGWLGARVTLVADELQDDADLRALPGASWRYLGTRFAGHLEVHHDFDADTGWLLQQDLLWSDTLTLSASWTRTPQGEDLVALVLQSRF